jgi:SAM-dependent methyltransferase
MASFDNWYSALDAHDSAYQRAVAEARGSDAAIAQQGFLPSSEIVALGEAAGAAPGTTVLDACCGTGGPAALLAEHLGARLVGVDIAEAGLQQAAARPRLAGRCAAADATRLPFLAGSFDAVVLFDSLVPIPDKTALAREVARVLRPGGQFGCTDLFGAPLTPAEQARLPGDTTAHLVPIDTWLATLRSAGIDPLHVQDRSAVAAGVAERLAAAFERHQAALAAEMGADQARDLLTTTRFWADLLARRRVSLLAVLAERSPSPTNSTQQPPASATLTRAPASHTRRSQHTAPSAPRPGSVSSISVS